MKYLLLRTYYSRLNLSLKASARWKHKIVKFIATDTSRIQRSGLMRNHFQSLLVFWFPIVVQKWVGSTHSSKEFRVHPIYYYIQDSTEIYFRALKPKSFTALLLYGVLVRLRYCRAATHTLCSEMRERGTANCFDYFLRSVSTKQLESHAITACFLWHWRTQYDPIMRSQQILINALEHMKTKA